MPCDVMTEGANDISMGYVKRLDAREFDPLRGKKPLLSQIDIELTQRCNNNCIHCCINLPERDSGALSREMETGFVKGILTEAAALGCLAVRFTGGEPLLHKDFPELYLFARRLGMQVILFTNARLITTELAELMAKFLPGRNVEVSVYGMNPKSYDGVAGRQGAFYEFRRGVDLLLFYRIPFIVKGPKLQVLKGEREEFEAWALSIPAMDKKPLFSMNFDLRYLRDDSAKNLRIAKLRATPEETVSMLASDPQYQKEMGRFCSMFMGPSGDRIFNCGAGQSPCVDAYGYAHPCLPLRHVRTAVDLHKTTLGKALKELFPAKIGMRATNPDYLRRCACCFLKGLCEQCPAKSWTENGTFDTPVEYLCSVAHAKARYLGLLGEHEHGWEVVNWKKRVAQDNQGSN
jgi:radical SAM protein with 4Fe4S-binding SPASM domain